MSVPDSKPHPGERVVLISIPPEDFCKACRRKTRTQSSQSSASPSCSSDTTKTVGPNSTSMTPSTVGLASTPILTRSGWPRSSSNGIRRDGESEVGRSSDASPQLQVTLVARPRNQHLSGRGRQRLPTSCCLWPRSAFCQLALHCDLQRSPLGSRRIYSISARMVLDRDERHCR